LRHEIVKKIEEEAKVFNHKYTEKEIKEMVKREVEAHATKISGGEVPSTDSYRRKASLYFLDDPVDKCMIKALFRQDDELMRFYEEKFKF
jgi:hypothetical protein